MKEGRIEDDFEFLTNLRQRIDRALSSSRGLCWVCRNRGSFHLQRTSTDGWKVSGSIISVIISGGNIQC
jgi:hypothetical protein